MIVEKKSRKGKQPLVSDLKSQIPLPYAKVPYSRRKKVKNQDLEFQKFMKMLN
ncbi:hypothetical protein A2U01_0098909, partial [Trifolium medium]|nr:hypothetical protein [Trifolium medium]